MIKMPDFGLDQIKLDPSKPMNVEPWMVDFVKGRHSQEEWDAFLVYCEAGPFKRGLIQFGWFVYRILVGSR